MQGCSFFFFCSVTPPSSLCVFQVQGHREPDGHPDVQRCLLDVSEGRLHLAAVHPAGRPRGRFLAARLHAGTRLVGHGTEVNRHAVSSLTSSSPCPLPPRHSGPRGARQRDFRQLRAVPAVQPDAPEDPLGDDLPGLLPGSAGCHLRLLLPHRTHAHQECARDAGRSQRTHQETGLSLTHTHTLSLVGGGLTDADPPPAAGVDNRSAAFTHQCLN